VYQSFYFKFNTNTMTKDAILMSSRQVTVRKDIRCCSSLLLRSFAAALAFILTSAFSMAQNATEGDGPLIIVKKQAYPGPDVVPVEVQSFLDENVNQSTIGILGDDDPEAVPEINNCPDDQTVECFSDVGHTVSELEYTLNCSDNGVIIIYEPAGILETGSCPGTEYIVTYVVWDECGNNTSCDQVFTLDNDAPQITSCPEGGVISDPSEAVSNVEALDFTFSCPEDPLCADILVEVALIEETDICVGNTYTYVYTITDGCGRTDQCEQVFTLPPDDLTLNCPDDAVVECSFNIAPSADDVSLGDDLDLDYSVDISAPTLVEGNEGCPGAVYEVVYTVTDEWGREATCTRNYTVENDGPIITAPVDIEVECSNDIVADIEGVVVSTFCEGFGEVLADEPVVISGDGDCNGDVWEINYNFTDECGGTSSDSQLVTIAQAGPTIVAPLDIVVECAEDAIPDIDGAFVEAPCGIVGEVTAEDPILVEGDGLCNGSVFEITYAVEDECGGFASDVQLVTLDIDGPTIAAPADIIIGCPDDAVADPDGVIVESSCSFLNEVEVEGPILTEGDGICVGSVWQFVYTVTDECGETAQDVQLVTLDNDGPTIIAPADIFIECPQDLAPDEENVTVTTSCGILSDIITDGPNLIEGDGVCDGSVFEYIYTVTDECGGEAFDSQLVTLDVPAPTILAPADITVECATDVLPDPEGATFSTGCGILGDVIADDPVIVDGDGVCDGSVFEITYSIEDACGAFATDVQLITLDTDAPTIAAPLDIVVDCAEDVLPDVDGVTFSTPCEIIGDVTSDGPVLVEGDGICDGSVFEITYTIVDECGGTASDIQLITLDVDDPTIVAPTDIFVACPEDIIPDEDGATVTTGCDILGEITTSDPELLDGDGFCDGSVFEVTYTLEDVCGGLAFDAQLFTLDLEGPSIEAPEDVTIECAADAVADIDGVEVSTSCDLGSEVTAEGPNLIEGDGFCDGSIWEFVYTVTDECGETASATQTVTIENDGPTIVAPDDVTIECAADAAADLDGVVVTTTCGLDNDVTVDGPNLMEGDGFCDGSVWEYVYTITDDCGRTASDVQVVTIENDGPTIVAPDDVTIECAADAAADLDGVVVSASCNLDSDVTVDGPNLMEGDGFCDGSVWEYVYTVTDDCGRTASDVQVVTIENDGPTIVAPDDVIIECAADAAADLDGVVVSASCNLDSDVTVDGPNLMEGDGFCDGSVWEFVYTVTDDCGRTASDVQVVTIENDGPTIVAPDDVTIECAADAAADIAGAVITTTCGLDSDVSAEGPNLIEGDGFCDGSVWEFVYTVTDDCGRTATDVQVVTIENDGPTIVAPDDVVLECAADAAADVAGVIFTTTCGLDSDVTAEGPNLIEGDGFCDGSVWEFVYTITDDCGRTASDVQMVTIENDGPTLEAPEDLELACITDFIADPALADLTTFCDDDAAVAVGEPVLVDGDGICELSQYTVSYSVTDACGRTAEDTQTLTVLNGALQVLEEPMDMTVECYDDINPDPFAIEYTTPCSSDVFIQVTPPTQLCCEFDCPGAEYSVTYSLSNTCGQTAEVEQIFTIDNDAPVILTCGDDMEVESEEDIEVSIDDVEYEIACGHECEIVVSEEAEVIDNGCDGTDYVYTYTVTDNCGRSTSCDRVFTVPNNDPDCQGGAECDDFSIYFVAHGPGVDGSDIYEVEIEDDQANLTFLNNVDFQTHIAFNALDNVLYLVNADGSEFVLYSPLADDFLGSVAIQGDIDQLYAVEYRPSDGKLYVGDDGEDAIYSIDVTSGETEFYANAPVSGGDLVYYDGELYLANRSQSTLYQVVEGGDAIALGSIPEEVNGMTPNNNGSNFITSNANLNNFVEISSQDGSTLGSFPAWIDGEPYTFVNGDLASGCADEEDSDIADLPSTILPSEVYPNPSDENATITFTPAVSARTVVELYDMTGRPIEGLFSRMTQEGVEYRVNVNTAQYEDGVYIYRITNGSHTVTKKIIVSR
jgi:hypothetical protein